MSEAETAPAAGGRRAIREVAGHERGTAEAAGLGLSERPADPRRHHGRTVEDRGTDRP